ncbi:hypothetical protein L9F63_017888, partial [Diploptera punctata]
MQALGFICLCCLILVTSTNELKEFSAGDNELAKYIVEEINKMREGRDLEFVMLLRDIKVDVFDGTMYHMNIAIKDRNYAGLEEKGVCRVAVLETKAAKPFIISHKCEVQ